MHIGLAIWHLFEGASGVERVMTDLARTMLERGHELTVAARRRPGQGVENSLPLFGLPAGATLLELDLSSPEGLREARARIGDSGADVFLSMCSGPQHMMLPWLLAGSGIPLVAAEAHYPDGVARQRWNAYEYYGALAAADYIQVLLEPFRAQFPKALRRRVAVIGNAAPPAREVDWPRRAEKKERTLLAVGRLDEPDKQFSLLIRAWAALAPDFPEGSLSLVGDGPSREIYASLAANLGLGHRFRMPGAADAEGLNAYYAEADLLCLPSRREGFGLVLAEAAAWSLPLVGLKPCLASAALIPEGGGDLAAEGTPAALAEALRPLLAARPETRRKMGESAGTVFSGGTSISRTGEGPSSFAAPPVMVNGFALGLTKGADAPPISGWHKGGDGGRTSFTGENNSLALSGNVTVVSGDANQGTDGARGGDVVFKVGTLSASGEAPQTFSFIKGAGFTASSGDITVR